MDVVLKEQHLIDIANSIREANGTEETYTPGEMAAAIAALEPLSIATFDDMVSGNFNTVSNTTVLRESAFQSAEFEKLSFPNCIETSKYSFIGCTIGTIDLPKCTTINNFSFYTSTCEFINLPSVTSISGYRPFYYIYGTPIINLSNCTLIDGEQVFYGMDVTINVPAGAVITDSALEGAKNVTINYV